VYPVLFTLINGVQASLEIVSWHAIGIVKTHKVLLMFAGILLGLL
jgi:hypothetical protein